MAAERSGDKTGMLWVESGEVRTALVATVAPVPPIDKTYSFTVPQELADKLAPGQRVLVELGRSGRQARAFCLSIETRPWTSTLKPILELLDPVSYLSAPLLQLGQWISTHYACPLGRTLDALVPKAVHRGSGFKTVRYVALAESAESIVQRTARMGAKQSALLEYLSASQEPVDVASLQEHAGVSSATVRQAADRGWVRIESRREASAAPDFDRPLQEPSFTLNQRQRAACEQVNAMLGQNGFGVGLLFGVSGSGKTEVYVQAMRRVLEQGRQVILLVPEIALTTQLVNRLACRFKNVAVVHSGLTDAQRGQVWNQIADGSRQVVIGTRSAVFAPCGRLGLIVVDEEQETSFKNLQAPRFHVRDVAIKRGQLEEIPVLLGSATPSLESWLNCERAGHYRRIDLGGRVHGQPMPQVHVADMREETTEQGATRLVSRLLETKLAVALGRGEQAILLLNRRGFAKWLLCPGCKQRVECTSCNTHMVYHAVANLVVCHYCGRRESAPTHCGTLGCGRALVRVGSGTQRIESYLQKRFPDKIIARVDSDTMRHRRMYQALIDDFEAGRIDVLAGTQMIAKGLDFPNVSLVGVLGADAAGASSDFRAGERLFQLITQVAGRAGRSRTLGQVVVQTINPAAPALLAAMDHDYDRFADQELPLRRRFGFPPYTRLARIVLADARAERSRQEAVAMFERLEQAIAALKLPHTDLLGPQPCTLTRIRGLYRYDLLIRAADPAHLQQLLDHIRAQGLAKARVKRVIIDVDPVSLT